MEKITVYDPLEKFRKVLSMVDPLKNLKVQNITARPQHFLFFDELTKQSQAVSALDEAGWLPHFTTPFDYIEDCGNDSEKIRRALTEYYREHWPTVQTDIEDRLNDYCLDQEAKETFKEALEAHKSKLYRCVCVVLFSGIEGVARRELFNNRPGQIAFKDQIHDSGLELPTTSLNTGGFYAVKLFQRLSDHFYGQTNDDEARQRFVQDPVPNRHAAIHGLVPYSMPQHSLNTIFMADFIFDVICALKRT